MITPPPSDEDNAPQMDPREDVHMQADSPSEWSNWGDDPASADDYQQMSDIDLKDWNDSGSRPSSPWVMPTEGVYLGEGWSRWVKRTDDDGNFVSYWTVTYESIFKDKFGHAKTYTKGPYAIPLVMPQPVHPRESFDTILFSNWDCHEEDGEIVITRQPRTINMPDNAGRVPSFLQTAREPSVTKPLRKTPEQWPSSLCFADLQKPVTGPSLSSSKVPPSNTSATLRQ